MIDLIDKVEAFEDWEKTILPVLKKDIDAGMSQEVLAQKYAALAQARVISEALTNPDANKALVAAKDIIDRAKGKATEKREVIHKLEKMTDAELDAILFSEEEDLENMEERFDQ